MTDIFGKFLIYLYCKSFLFLNLSGFVHKQYASLICTIFFLSTFIFNFFSIQNTNAASLIRLQIFKYIHCDMSIQSFAVILFVANLLYVNV